MTDGPVGELRVALTVDDFEAAVRFYRDRFGLAEVLAWDEPTGRGSILDAGRATLELISPDQAALIDEVEVGARTAGPVRLAMEVGDSTAMAERLVAAGAEALGAPVTTPWGDRNVRLRAPDGMQLTLFTPGGHPATPPGSPAPAETELLKRAVALATGNAAAGQHPFAAFVVLGGELVGTGVNTVLRDRDPSAHAETAAIRDACRALGTATLAGATVVSSCEPCPLCRSVALLAGVARIVYAAPRETAAAYGFVVPADLATVHEQWPTDGSLALEHQPVAEADEPFARFAADGSPPTSG